MFADVILYNGTIYTMDESNPQVSAVAIKDKRIIALDQEAEKYVGPETRQKDMQGKTMLPGFIESHAHPIHYAESLYALDLKAEKTPDIQSILDAVREKAKNTPDGEWITGLGWDDSKLKEKRFPTIDELSEAAPNNPVFLKRTCVHNAVVNRMAFSASHLPEIPEDPEGGHYHIDEQSNKPSGLIQENAMMDFAVPAMTTEQLMEAMLKAQAQFYRWGITTVHDMAVTKEEMTVFQQLQQNPDFTMKVRMWLWAIDQMGWTGVQQEAHALGLTSLFGNDQLNIQGLKYMLDGSVGGRTAAVQAPYEHEPSNRGILYMSQETIDAYVQEAADHGMRISIHGIGERAVDMAIQAITKTDTPEHNQTKRHRIEHCALPSEDHLKQMKAHGMIAGSSIGFVYSIGDSYLANLGEERAARVFPQASFKKWGIRAPGNSDLPVCDGNPFYGIYSCVTRKTTAGQQLGTKEAISVHDALNAYTIDAAYAGFDEDKIGSIEVGKYADLITLNQDPYHISEEDLKGIKVEQTMVEGKVVYQAD